MAKNYGIKDIESWSFEEVAIPQIWKEHLGEITKPFKMLILGDPKNGKTEYAIQLGKMLAECYGKVNLNSPEQGKSKTLQMAFIRNDLGALSGKFMLCDQSKKKFRAWFEYLSKPNSGQVIMLDSVDYMEMTFEEWKELIERFKNKSFIVIAWSNPMNSVTKQIKYQVDIVIEVKDYVASVRGRLGGESSYVIWQEGARRAGSLKKLPRFSNQTNLNL